MELQLPLSPTADDLVKLESLYDSVEAILENGSVETPPLLRYLAKVIPRSALGALRSLTIHSDRIPLEDSKARACIEWPYMPRILREEGAINLRFLRLSIFYPALPSLPDLRGMTAAERFGLVREIVHGAVWPLDAGDSACLPFGMSHLELELWSKTVCLGYRLCRERQALPFPHEAIQRHNSEWFDSRRLPGGRLQGVGESVRAVDWIEELGWNLRDWPRWGD